MIFDVDVFPTAGATLMFGDEPLSLNCTGAPVAETVIVCDGGAELVLLATQNVSDDGATLIEALWACAVSRKHNGPTKTVMSQVMNLKRFGTDSLQLRGGILVLLEQSSHHLRKV